MMSDLPPRPEELAEYLGRYCEATLTPEELARLEQWLANDPQAMAQFLLYMEIHSSLAWRTRARSAFVGDSCTPSGVEPARRARPTLIAPDRAAFLVRLMGNRPTRRLVLSLSTLAAVIVAAIWWTNARQSELAQARPGPGQPAARQAEPVPAAGEGDRFPRVTALTCEHGFTTLYLDRIGSVVLDERSDFKLIGPMRARLNRGRIKMQVTEPAGHGFAVETPFGEVTDLGTKFGLSVQEDSGAGLVVFEGKVDLRVKRPTSGPSQAEDLVEHLVGGEGVTFGRNGELGRIGTIRTDRVATFRTTHESAPGDPVPVIVDVSDNLRTDDTRQFYEIVTGGLGEDTLAFVDRPEHEWNGLTQAGIPPYLIGADYVKTFVCDRNRDRLEISVVIGRPAKLYVFYDKRARIPEWLKRSFRDTGDVIGLDEGRRPAARGEVVLTTRDVGPGNSIDTKFSVWEQIVPNPCTIKLGRVIQPVRSSRGLTYGIAAVPLKSDGQ